MSVSSVTDPDLLFGMASGGDQVRILSYASEGTPITRSDVLAYQSQLIAVRQQASSQIAKPLIGLLSSVDNPMSQGLVDTSHMAPVKRGFGLSDEPQASRAVAGIDKGEMSQIISQLQMDLEPVHRPWSTQQQQAAESSNFYNYGLNERLIREYIEAQLALRIERGRRQSMDMVGSTDVAGNRDSAMMRPPPPPPPMGQAFPQQQHRQQAPMHTEPPPQGWGQPSWQAPPAAHDPWKV